MAPTRPQMDCRAPATSDLVFLGVLTMPNSFSRFLNEEELKRVRELYLKSLQDAEQGAEPTDPGSTETTAETAEG